MTATATTATARMHAAIAVARKATADRAPEFAAADRAAAVRDAVRQFTVPQMVEFFAAEGVRFGPRPSRAEVVDEVVEAFGQAD